MRSLFDFAEDAWLGLRQIGRRPGFHAVVIFVFALGIGVTGAMLAVVRGVLLVDPPFRDSNRIVVLSAPQPGVPDAPYSGPDFVDIAAQTKSLAAAAAFSSQSTSIASGGEAVSVASCAVTGRFFEVLGYSAEHGRLLDSDDEAKAERVMVISDDLYRTRFGGDPTTVGRTVKLGGETYVVVGVLGPEERFGGYYATTDVWIPLPLSAPGAPEILTERGSHNFMGIGRLADGVDVATAQSELSAIAARLEQAYPQTNTHVGARVVSLKEHMVGRSRRPLTLLFGAILAVLLLACVNVANLLLSRGASRRGEIAMRAALGASRGRIVRQLLAEATALSLVGGGLGLIVALWAVDLFKSFFASAVLPAVLARVHLDAASVGGTIAIAVASGVAAGIAPALAVSRPEAFESLKEGAARATTGTSGRLLRNVLVGAQVAIAVCLLAGAGLLGKSFAAVTNVDIGFSTQNRYAANVTLPSARFDGEDRIIAYERAVANELAGRAGVTAVATVDRLPQGGWNTNGDIVIDGRPPFAPGESPDVERRRASASYFATLDIRIVKGRDFTESDVAGSAPVMIVNEAFARRFFPGEDPIGKRARWDTDNLPFAEIVGVVADIRDGSPDAPASLVSYLPFAQHPDPSFAFVIRTSPGADGNAILRSALAAVDPEQPPSRVQPLSAVTARQIAARRATMTLLAAFAAIAVLLAALGIYGVVAHRTAERTREVGIRLALGATPRDVVGMVVGQSMTVVAIGLGAGLALALAGSGMLDSFLFETSALDLRVYAGVTALVAVVGLLASLLPARRAAAVPPSTSLRYE